MSQLNEIFTSEQDILYSEEAHRLLHLGQDGTASIAQTWGDERLTQKAVSRSLQDIALVSILRQDSVK